MAIISPTLDLKRLLLSLPIGGHLAAFLPRGYAPLVKNKAKVRMSKDRQQLRMQVKVIIFTGFVLMATGIFVELVVLK